MVQRCPVVLANSLLVASCLRSHFAFKAASRRVERTQRRVLLDVIRRARGTRFGIAHGFDRVNSVEDFQARVPISDFSTYSAYIEAIANGQQNVLTPDPVQLLQPSSGSTSASKRIPFTGRLRDEFMRAVKPWIVDLFTNRKQLLLGRSYWAITPAGENSSPTTRDVPVGFSEDSGYFGPLGRVLLKRLLVVPDEVGMIADIDAFRYVTLLYLLKEKNLTFISIWNPTFLTLLTRRFQDWAGALVKDVGRGTINPPGEIRESLKRTLTGKLRGNRRRANELEGIFRRSGDGALFRRVWPRLRVISCWCDGNAARFIPELRSLFPGVEVQPKGLMATEGVVSFPWIGSHGCPLAIRSHFYEFAERASREETDDVIPCGTKLAHELREGKHYSVILTTGGGLYRYHLQDIVKVVGFRGKLPLIRFVAKEDSISDVVGEKLNAAHVERVLLLAWQRHGVTPSFYMLAPERPTPEDCFYALFVRAPETAYQRLQDVADEVEEELRQNFHYDYCRKLGQLSPLKIYLVDEEESSPTDKYLSHLATLGRKLGTVKSSVLERDLGWSKVFHGRFI